MKKTLCALLAGLLCLLSGCSGILEREHLEVTPHNDRPEVVGSSDAIRVENYQEIVNALLYLVIQGEHSGTLRLYDYDQDIVERDLNAACLEVSEEDPLGAYSVDYIQFDLDTIISYQQADIQITYRRSHTQVLDIISTAGISAVRTALEGALASYDDSITLKVSYYDGTKDDFTDLLTRAYYSNPASAMGLPTVEITLYPRTGAQRIAEIFLDYPQIQASSRTMADSVARAALRLSGQVTALELDDQIDELSQILLAENGLSPDGATPYDVLCGTGGNSEGLALAYVLLCAQLDIPCVVVRGTSDGTPHFWNVVKTADGYAHLDLTTIQPTDDAVVPIPLPLMGDSTAEALGYQWNQSWVPVCAERTAEP